MRSIILMASAFLLAVATDLTGDPKFQHPLLKEYRTDEVLSDVTIAVSAATAHVNKQMDGYVLVP